MFEFQLNVVQHEYTIKKKNNKLKLRTNIE